MNVHYRDYLFEVVQTIQKRQTRCFPYYELNQCLGSLALIILLVTLGNFPFGTSLYSYLVCLHNSCNKQYIHIWAILITVWSVRSCDVILLVLQINGIYFSRISIAYVTFLTIIDYCLLVQLLFQYYCTSTGSTVLQRGYYARRISNCGERRFLPKNQKIE